MRNVHGIAPVLRKIAHTVYCTVHNLGDRRTTLLEPSHNNQLEYYRRRNILDYT